MAESAEIARLREHIQHQRERVAAHDEPAEPVAAEPVADPGHRAFDARSRRPSAFDSVVDIVREHPGVAIGIGATLLVAGPRRSLKLARGAMRGALFMLATYRGVTSVLSMLSTSGARAGAMRSRQPGERMRR